MNSDLLFVASISACGALIFGVLWWASRQPLEPKWKDDGDCKRIVLHTVRVPVALERLALWAGRYALVKECGEKGLTWSSEYGSIRVKSLKKLLTAAAISSLIHISE